MCPFQVHVSATGKRRSISSLHSLHNIKTLSSGCSLLGSLQCLSAKHSASETRAAKHTLSLKSQNSAAASSFHSTSFPETPTPGQSARQAKSRQKRCSSHNLMARRISSWKREKKKTVRLPAVQFFLRDKP